MRAARAILEQKNRHGSIFFFINQHVQQYRLSFATKSCTKLGASPGHTAWGSTTIFTPNAARASATLVVLTKSRQYRTLNEEKLNTENELMSRNNTPLQDRSY